MIETILVPTDGSAYAKKALDLATPEIKRQIADMAF